MTFPTGLRALAPLLAAASLLVPTARGQAPTISRGAIEALPTVTETHPIPAVSGLSADGRVVAGIATPQDAFSLDSPPPGLTPFVWRAEMGYRRIDVPDSLGSASIATEAEVSADGTVVVGTAVFEDSGTGLTDYRQRDRAYRWTAADGLTWLPIPDGHESGAHAVSANGSFVAGEIWSDAAPNKQVVRWSRTGERTPVGALDGHERSLARDMSADGSVIVGTSFPASPGFARTAFRWTPEEGVQPLDVVAETYDHSEAFAVSADGRTIVGYAYSGPLSNFIEAVAFRWRADEDLLILGRWFPKDVSADGETVVGDARGGAVVWTRYSGLRRIRDAVDAEGWWLDGVTGVSADGTLLVGTGDAPDGTSTSWRARLREEPSDEPRR